MPEDNDDVSITYTVRELLSKINDALVEIKNTLGGKADQVTLNALEKRVLSLERITWTAGGIGVVAGALLWLHQIGVLRF